MFLKIAVFIFAFVVLFLCKELYQFIRAITDDKLIGPYKEKMSKLRLMGIALAISYICVIIFTGFGL